MTGTTSAAGIAIMLLLTAVPALVAQDAGAQDPGAQNPGPPAVGGQAVMRVLDAGAHHLGDDPQPEWPEAAEAPEGTSLTLAFKARDTGGEQTLFLTQRNVNARWVLRINGVEVAVLRTLGERREVAYRVPAGVLADAANSLLLEVPGAAGSFDDVTFGPLRLDERPLEEALHLRPVRISVRAASVGADAGPGADTGTGLPARVTLTDSAGVPVPQELIVRPAGAPPLPLRDGLVYVGDGPVDLALPPHAIEVWAVHGPEWSLGRATIAAIAPAEVVLELHREVDTTGFVAADTHLHTVTFSGHGDASLDERLWTLAGEGVELAIATDHNHVTDYRPRQKELQLGAWYTAVPGDEVTTALGHFNAFPLDPAAPPPEHRIDDWVALVAGIRAAGAQTVVLNHPRWPGEGEAPFARLGLDTLTGARAGGSAFTFDAMELTNSTDPHPDPLALFTDWFALLNRGERIAAVGSSDSHSVGDPVGQGRTWVPSATDDPAAIDVPAACRAIAQGRTSLGQGMFATIRVNERFTMGDLVPVEGNRVHAVLTVRAPSWVVPRVARLFVDGVEVARTDLAPAAGEPTDIVLPFDVTLHGHDAWLVAVVTGDEVAGPFWPGVNRYTLGATNPVFLDADRDGECTRPRLLAAARLARLRAGGKLPGAERAALLRGDAAVLLHMLDQLQPDETALREELGAVATAAGGVAAQWVHDLSARAEPPK